MENLAKLVHIKSLNNGYRFELCMCRSFINRRGGVTGVTYGFTAALGGEIHAHLASPRYLILLKKKSQQLYVSNFQIWILCQKKYTERFSTLPRSVCSTFCVLSVSQSLLTKISIVSTNLQLPTRHYTGFMLLISLFRRYIYGSFPSYIMRLS